MTAARTTATRTPGTPILVGRRWQFLGGRTVPFVAGGDGDEPIDLEALQGEQIQTITDDDLSAHADELVAEFDRLYDEAQSSGKPDTARMTELGKAIKAVRAERDRRQTATDEAMAQAQALADEIHASDTGTEGTEGEGGDGGEGGDPQPAGDPAPGEGGEGADDTQRESVTAASTTPPAPRRGASPAATSRHAPRPRVTPAGAQVVITAAAGVPGYRGGEPIDVTGIGLTMHEVAATLPDHSNKVRCARIRTPFPADRTIGKAMSAEAGLVVIEAATRVDSAQSLVAAGGWCTPSQNLYDLFSVSGRTGLIDLPTVGIERGGVNFPDYIGLDTAVTGALWVWSEDQDEQVTINITDLDISSGVGTMTSSPAHLLAVGDIVNVNVGTAADGPRVVTAVADATHATLNMTGVADGTNAVGTGTRNKSCFEVPCATWTEERLIAYGICVKNGTLQERAFPEITRRFVDIVMDGHAHRMSAVHLAKILTNTHSSAVTMTNVATDAYAEVLNAVWLQVADYRSQYHIADNVVIEVLLPVWIKQAMRATLAMRAGVPPNAVTDAQITAEFTSGNVRPQFLEDYQGLYGLTTPATAAVAWPGSLQFIIYPAGGFFEGNGGMVDLLVQRDSTLNATNDFTVAFSEEFRLLGRRGPKARRVTVPTITVDGVTACCA